MRTVEIIAKASDSMNSACPTERLIYSFCEMTGFVILKVQNTHDTVRYTLRVAQADPP